MKRHLLLVAFILSACVAFAQAEKSIIIDASKFRPVQSDALTGVNIDPIGLDYSKRPCARLKIKINRMTVEEINGIEVKVVTNNAVMKSQTAEYDMGLIVEMTAKPNTRFYFHHNEFGDSNEVMLNLEPDKEYYLEAYLNQLYSIVINSNVADADVYIDGVFKGRTDASNSLIVKDVLVGEHTLRLTYGGMDHEQKIVVNSGSISFRQNINTAASKPQFVVFLVSPASAVVTIGGNHYPLQDGALQLVLENGTYNYTVSAAGYHKQSGTFSVAGSKVERVIDLVADAALVTLTAPNNAEIWVNGAKKGSGKWSGTLASGTYIFEARKAGHTTASISKSITSSQPQQSYMLPAPTPMVGALTVVSTPVMADVALDGKAVGRTPIELPNLLIGAHTLTITKSGYYDYTQKVTILEGKTASVTAALKKHTAPLKPVSATVQPQSGKTYKVGDYYNDGKKEGVVFEVSADGKSGKIVSLRQHDYLYWVKDSNEAKLLIGAASESDGALNMAKVKEIPDWEKNYEAFKWCADLGEGWYLPAVNEVSKFTVDTHSVRAAVNNTLIAIGGREIFEIGSEKWYWTSTEFKRGIDGVYEVRSIGMKERFVGYLKKNQGGRAVRAVAAFGESDSKQPPKAATVGYSVGDYYNDGVKEGVVFDVWDEGRSGKIISLVQSRTPLQWASDDFERSRFCGTTNRFDGTKNMRSIEGVVDWQKKYPAFKWCTDLGEGWYLPAIEEWRLLMNNQATRVAVNYTLASYNAALLRADCCYWSSTENNKESRYMLKSGYNSAGEISGYSSKDNQRYIRAVATFGTEPHPSVKITSPPYKVGDYYNDGQMEGVVFSVDAGGQSGKIVAMCRADGLLWAKKVAYTDADKYNDFVGATNKTDGWYNTQRVKEQNDWQTNYPAFRWCAALGEQWYIPAADELQEIYNHKELLNAQLEQNFELYNHLNCSYWGSNESFGNSYYREYDAGGYEMGKNGFVSGLKYKGWPDKKDYVSLSNFVLPVAKFGNKSTQTPAAKRYKIGDYYEAGGKKGVVFWVSDDGQHGKIIGLNQSPEKLQWSSDKKIQRSSTSAENYYSGAKNMQTIAQIDGWKTKFPAFAWAAVQGEGWYIPAGEELLLLLKNKSNFDKVNETITAKGGVALSTTEYYWSSDDYGRVYDYKKAPKDIAAYCVKYGYASTSFKYNLYYVRVVAEF